MVTRTQEKKARRHREMTRIIKEIPILNHPQWNVIRVELYYTKGGMNYFTGENVKRGLWLSVIPMEVGQGSFTVTWFTGTRVLVKEMKKFSQKTLETFEPDNQKVKELINRIINKHNLECENV